MDEIRVRACAAELLGIACGWVPYLPWSLDALASVQAAGAVTAHLELGTAVIPTFFSHPLALARQAATTQAAIGRPIVLGVGSSNQFVLEMHGIAYDRPAAHVREYLEVLQAVASSDGGQVVFEGALYRVNSMYAAPGTAPPPVLVGALGPLMLRAAGALSDGTIATWSNPRAIEVAIRPELERSASEAGRTAPRVGAVVPFMVTEDASAGRALAAEKFGIFDSLPRYKRMVELGGVRSAADVCIVGDEKTLRDALAAYRDAGLTDFLAAPLCGAERSASWQRSAEALAWAAAELN
jgi:F420-dependent oxidoreductase-like protein